MMSSSRITSSSSPLTLTVWPEYLPNSTRSPTLTSSGRTLPSSCALAFADGDDFALVGFFGGGVGNDDARSGFALFVQALDDDAVVQRTDFHRFSRLMKSLENRESQGWEATDHATYQHSLPASANCRDRSLGLQEERPAQLRLHVGCRLCPEAVRPSRGSDH